jgi:hypothetical protein
MVEGHADFMIKKARGIWKIEPMPEREGRGRNDACVLGAPERQKL